MKKPIEFIDAIRLHLNNKRKAVNRKDRIKIYLIEFGPALLLYFLLPWNLIIKLLVCVLWYILAVMFFDHRTITEFRPTVNIWFGVPGSGKTSVGAWLSRNSIKHHYKVLSNVEIKDTYILNEEDLGNYDMSFNGDGCHVIYDEATANGLDNRDFKQFSKAKKLYFSLHRHMHNRIDVFSQDFDVDLKIKGRAGENGLFHLRRLPIRGFVMYRQISKIMFINKEDKQFIDGFKYYGLPRILYVRSVWNSFDTLDMSLCPKEQKDWKMWGADYEE